jgi:peptidylprolyl isomerase
MRTSLRRMLGSLAVLGMIVVGATGCGTSSPKTPQKTVAAGPCDIGVSTNVSVEPTISVPSCAVAPTTLQITDVVVGKGVAAKAGDAVAVKYYGAGFDNHKKFDSSWTDGAPDQEFTVAPLGQAGVIAGWNQGLIGAKVGTRRLLVIPPNLGYGAAGSPPITPNETLIFVVDVIAIT